MMFRVFCISTAHMYGETERERDHEELALPKHNNIHQPEDRLITVATAAS